MNTYELARYADCGIPDSDDSPGANFLRTVASYVEDITDPDDIHELADQAIPIYTHELWQVFVDLGAYNEDTDEYGPPRDLTHAAQIALYMIADRLLHALYEQQTEAPNGYCDDCGTPIPDAEPGHVRRCSEDPEHDPYSDGHNNGGDPVR